MQRNYGIAWIRHWQIRPIRSRLAEPVDFAEFLSAAGWAVGAADLRLRRAGIMAKRILDYGRVAWLSLPVARAFCLSESAFLLAPFVSSSLWNFMS